MPNDVIDLPTLRTLHANLFQVYRALFAAEAYTVESEQVVAQTDALLRAAGYAFLTGSPPSTTAPTVGAPVAGMVAAAVDVQKGYAALLQTLRQLALAHVDRANWRAAQPLLAALTALDPKDRTIRELNERAEPWIDLAAAVEAGNYATAVANLNKMPETDQPAACTLLIAASSGVQTYTGEQDLGQQLYRQAVCKPHPTIHGLEMVRIPAGYFQYGGLYGAERELVYVGEFWIGRTPITNAQYKQFQSDWTIPAGKEDHPVVNVSWEDAQQFCSKAGVRLPQEREWEKAARGVDGREYPWGNEPPGSTRCNFNNLVKDTTPVERYPQGASPYGMLDMAGNVWEWCEDAYDGSSRVLRGGAFSDDASFVRCTFRLRNSPADRHFSVGFRVVCHEMA